jgi:hypothetical protein
MKWIIQKNAVKTQTRHAFTHLKKYGNLCMRMHDAVATQHRKDSYPGAVNLSLHLNPELTISTHVICNAAGTRTQHTAPLYS